MWGVGGARGGGPGRTFVPVAGGAPAAAWGRPGRARGCAALRRPLAGAGFRGGTGLAGRDAGPPLSSSGTDRLQLLGEDQMRS